MRRIPPVTVVLLLLSANAPAFAQKSTLNELAAAGGRVAFLARGLVVLDLQTGTVMARERNVTWAQVLATPAGLLVGTTTAATGWTPVRYRLFSTHGDPVWDVPCELRRVEPDHLICVDPGSSRSGQMVQVRRLTDAHITRAYNAGRDAPEAVFPGRRLPTPETEFTPREQELAPRLHPLEEGALVAYARVQADIGGLFELRSSRARRWQVVMPYQRAWTFNRALEADGVILIESNSWDFGTLDAVPVETGVPLWRFVFPAESPLRASRFSVPFRAARFSASAWQELQENPPPALVAVEPPLPLQRYQPASLNPLLTVQAGVPAPVTFDPDAVPPWTTRLFESTLMSIPVVVAAALLLASRNRQFSPPGSARRAVYGVAVFLVCVATFIYYGLEMPPVLAGAAAVALLVVSYVNSLAAAVRVEARRGTIVLRVGLVLLHMVFGMFLLGALSPWSRSPFFIF